MIWRFLSIRRNPKDDSIKNRVFPFQASRGFHVYFSRTRAYNKFEKFRLVLREVQEKRESLSVDYPAKKSSMKEIPFCNIRRRKKFKNTCTNHFFFILSISTMQRLSLTDRCTPHLKSMWHMLQKLFPFVIFVCEKYVLVHF